VFRVGSLVNYSSFLELFFVLGSALRDAELGIEKKLKAECGMQHNNEY